MALTTKSKIHKRMCNFLEFITPKLNSKKDDDSQTLEERIVERSKKIREIVLEEAKNDGLVVTQTPNAGSFAKKTGLCRKLRGSQPVDGFDVDMPIVLKNEDKSGNELDNLLTKFKKYCEKVEKKYSGCKAKKTKSSIEIETGEGFYYDIVPMLATDKNDEQILIKSNGDRIQTSVQKHIDFVKSRTKESDELKGRVKFNECVRLLKWWREMQAQNEDEYFYLLGEDKPASIVIELLCAWAFKECQVKETYAETLHAWFSYLYNQVKNKVDIIFGDNYAIASVKHPKPKHFWTVLDPVASDNNVVKKWSEKQWEEFCKWLEIARDTFARAIRMDANSEDSKSMDELVVLFGNPFRNNSDN